MEKHLTEERVRKLIVEDANPSLIFRHIVPLLDRIENAVRIVTEKGVDAYDVLYVLKTDSLAAEKRDALEQRRMAKELFGQDDKNARRRMRRAKVEAEIEHTVFRAIHALCDNETPDTTRRQQ